MTFYMTQKGLSSEAIAVLRDCRLSSEVSRGVDEKGVSFIRCGRNLGADNAMKIAAEICTKLGDTKKDVFWTTNEELGLNDYVRVNHGSSAYSLICYMKS